MQFLDTASCVHVENQCHTWLSFHWYFKKIKKIRKVLQRSKSVSPRNNENGDRLFFSPANIVMSPMNVE